MHLSAHRFLDASVELIQLSEQVRRHPHPVFDEATDSDRIMNLLRATELPSASVSAWAIATSASSAEEMWSS
ncbi:hypothetical protein [uncultured Microbacterium sp.]|uniref:hypothetical protein n=1 Tax=uncultured Microbacterium sp. TaxID=191216 RepID=UPI0035CB6F49